MQESFQLYTRSKPSIIQRVRDLAHQPGRGVDLRLEARERERGFGEQVGAA